MDDQLRRLQLLEVEMLDEFVRICEKYHFTYYLGFGTLLGAVRHHGFIPWDDDLDVLMSRKDFNLFCKVAPQELDSRYFFHTSETDPHYPDAVARIRQRNTVYAEDMILRMNLKNYGCWIDIYPLDHVKNPCSVKLFFQGYAAMTAKGFAFYRPVQNLAGLPFQKRLKHYLSLIFPLRIWVAIRDALFQLDSECETGYVIPFAGTTMKYWRKRIMPEEWYGEPAQVEFEGKIYNAPHEYDSFLRQVYGDYMQLPPVEERKGHPPAVWEM